MLTLAESPINACRGLTHTQNYLIGEKSILGETALGEAARKPAYRFGDLLIRVLGGDITDKELESDGPVTVDEDTPEAAIGSASSARALVPRWRQKQRVS